MKTPAPDKLDALTRDTVKELIEANPASQQLQGMIKSYKDKFPADFEGVIPKPISSLTDEAKEKRNKLL